MRLLNILLVAGRCAILATAIALSCASAKAQTSPAPDPQKSAAQQFPFPGESPSAPATRAPSSTPPPSAAKQFPYPGEAPASGDTPDAPVSGSSSPSSSSSNSGNDSSSSSSSSSSSGSSSTSDSGVGGANDGKAPPNGEPADAPHVHHERRRLPKVDAQSHEQREAEDVRVAAFYQNDGNFTAAYARAKDAVSLDATDPDAFVVLGNSARRLGKLDEAEKAYTKALTLDPFPKTRKLAEKALEEMRGH